MREIDEVTKSLETLGHFLASCHQDISILIDSVSKQTSLYRSPLYKCTLVTTWIVDDADCVTDTNLESGDMEMRNRSEARAVSCLLLLSQNPNPSPVMES